MRRGAWPSSYNKYTFFYKQIHWAKPPVV